MAVKLFYGAANRNKGPICDIWKQVLDDYFTHATKVTVLEIASGTGQHAIHISSMLPKLVWQPTEVDSRCLNSINAYIEESSLTNIRKPSKLDVTQPVESLKRLDDQYDVIFAVNFEHITPWKCSKALYKLAGSLLSAGGILLTYGPYADNGVLTPESNVRFNTSLKLQNSSWGIRDITDLSALAKDQNMKLETIYNMPANNKILIWKKQS